MTTTDATGPAASGAPDATRPAPSPASLHTVFAEQTSGPLAERVELVRAVSKLGIEYLHTRSDCVPNAVTDTITRRLGSLAWATLCQACQADTAQGRLVVEYTALARPLLTADVEMGKVLASDPTDRPMTISQQSWWSTLTRRTWELDHPVEGASELTMAVRRLAAGILLTKRAAVAAHLAGVVPQLRDEHWTLHAALAAHALGRPGQWLPPDLVPNENSLRVLRGGYDGTSTADVRMDHSAAGGSTAIPAKMRNAAYDAYLNTLDPLAASAAASTVGHRLLGELPDRDMDEDTARLPAGLPVPAGDYATVGELAAAAWSAAAEGDVNDFADTIWRTLDTAARTLDVTDRVAIAWNHDDPDPDVVERYGVGRFADGTLLLVGPRVLVTMIGSHELWGPVTDEDTWDLFTSAYTLRGTAPGTPAERMLDAVRACRV